MRDFGMCERDTPPLLFLWLSIFLVLIDQVLINQPMQDLLLS
jgi:hypothetical protein